MPRRNSRDGIVLLLMLVVGLLALNCSDDSAPRSIVTVESINANESLDSDVYNNGADGEPGTDDDTIFEDQVAIVVRNHPHDSALSVHANGPFGAIVFTHYEIHFQGDDSLPSVAGAMHLRVVTGATATGEITVIPAAYKVVPPLLGLRQGGEIMLSAEIRLLGVEEDSQNEIVATATLPVHCANWGDKQQ